MSKQSRDLTDAEKAFVLDQLLEGRSYNFIAKRLGFSEAGFCRYRKRDPLFEAEMIRAREDGLADLAASVTDLVDIYKDPQAARVKFDSIRWYLAVMDPFTYGRRARRRPEPDIDLRAILDGAPGL